MKNVLTLLWIMAIIFVVVKLESPISAPSDVEKSKFRIDKVKSHIENMASEVHFMGTSANEKVRDYIINEFEKIGAATEIFVGYTETSWRNSYKRMAKTENIIATIKGKSSEKAVLIAGHYDSVLNGPGAADDVHAVASMIEVARILANSNPENDIIFLVTDGEEMGLFGAKAFTESRDLSNIGLVLNYEARGNSGPSISFEWSDGNAWLVEQVKKAGRRPIANSMSFEIYKRLPNDTDFTYMKSAGLTGINHAFIDGFSYYHNPIDNPETINMNSVYHTGINMLSLVEHFGNIDISNTRTHNASFFNFYNSLIIYPSSVDVYLLVLTLVLVLSIVYFSYKNKLITSSSFFIGLLALILLVGTTIGLMVLLTKYLSYQFPHYDVFYTGQFYNHKFYLCASIGMAILLTWKGIGLFKKSKKDEGLKVSVLVLLAVLCVLFYMFLPTAAYFMLIPTIASCTAYIFSVRTSKEPHKYTKYLSFFVVLIPLGIWSPAIINIFLAFSIKMLAGPAFLTVLTCLVTYVIFPDIWTGFNWLGILGGLLFVGSMIGGRITSKPTDQYPLPSSAFYNYNVDDQKSYYVTNDKELNIGNDKMLKGAEKLELQLGNKTTKWAVETKVKSDIRFELKYSDSLNVVNSLLTYDDEAFLTRLYFTDTKNIIEASVNGYKAFQNRKNDGSLIIDIFGITQDSLHISLVKRDSAISQKVAVNSKFLKITGHDDLPSNARRADNYTSVSRTISF